MIRFSASSVPRLLVCPGSAHLPHHAYESKWADLGDGRHADAETAADMGATDELPDQVRELMLPGDELATECAMAYDVSDDTARALGHISWRDYRDLRQMEIPMTIDLIIRGSGRIVVVDYKGFEEVDDAETNAQLATGALAVARAGAYTEVTVAIIYLGATWKPPSVALLCEFDLNLHADRLRALVASSDRTLRVSKHCKYCPAFHDCPEQKMLAVDAGGGALAIRIEGMIPFANDDDAADAFDLMQRIKTLTTRIHAALYARAAERPIPLRNGKWLGKVQKQGNEKLDGDVVYDVVKALHGQNVADAAVIRSATKVRLKAAVKSAPAMKAVLDEVRSLGGSKREDKEAIEEYVVQLRVVSE